MAKTCGEWEPLMTLCHDISLGTQTTANTTMMKNLRILCTLLTPKTVRYQVHTTDKTISEKQLVGSCDFVFTNNQDKTTAIEIKTSAGGWHESWGVQVALYAKALKTDSAVVYNTLSGQMYTIQSKQRITRLNKSI